MKILLLLICALLLTVWLKDRVKLYVLSMWMVEQKIAPPTDEYGKLLAERVVRKWFGHG